MKCKIVFKDGTYFIGRRVNFWETFKIMETLGTHHWIVITSNYPNKFKVGERIAVPINSMEYMIFL